MSDVDMRIVLVGHTGGGKSSTGNSILLEYEKERQPLSISVGASSETSHCALVQKGVLGKLIRVIDTPGLFDTERGNDEILIEMSKCLVFSYPGPHVILVVVKAGERVTSEYQQTIELVLQIFGPAVKRYMMLVVTAVDQLERNRVSVDTWLSKAPACVRDIAYNTAGGFVGFNNTLTGFNSENQVARLFTKVDDMLRANGRSFYSSLLFEEMSSILHSAVGADNKKLLDVLKGIEKNRRDTYGLFHDVLKMLQRRSTAIKFQNLEEGIEALLEPF